MQRSALVTYFDEIHRAVQAIENVYVERFEEEIFTPNRANLRIRIRFESGYLLEINEAVTVQSKRMIHLSYRYHFQDEQNTLIFRYDDTPHFPKLENFPYHKHQGNEVVASVRPSILSVFDEAAHWRNRVF